MLAGGPGLTQDTSMTIAGLAVIAVAVIAVAALVYWMMSERQR